jgi:hypothetical protein
MVASRLRRRQLPVRYVSRGHALISNPVHQPLAVAEDGRVAAARRLRS